MEQELSGNSLRLEKQKDGLGNSVLDYLNKTAKFESPQQILKSGSEAEGLRLLANARHSTIASLRRAESPPFIPNLTTSTSGGWETFGHRTELETDPLDRCDIRQFQGLPTHAELKVFLESDEPVVFRGAGAQLGLPKYLWNLQNFMQRYQNASALVSKVPYTHQTDSPFRQQTSFRTQVADFLATFNENCNANNRSMNGGSTSLSCTIDNTCSESVPEPEESEIQAPMYLFASEFYLKNPLLLENMTAPFDLVREVTGTTLHQGGTHSDWAGLERNAQMYVGAPGSGAPMHYHQIAINYLAYGLKRWAMLPPAQSFYSMEPSLSYFSGEGYQRDKHKLLECTQKPDDLFLLPDSWGHVTLNVEASIGVAYEFEYAAWLVRIPEMLPTHIFENREDLVYPGWAIDHTDPWNAGWLKKMKQDLATRSRKSNGR